MKRPVPHSSPELQLRAAPCLVFGTLPVLVVRSGRRVASLVTLKSRSVLTRARVTGWVQLTFGFAVAS